MTQEMQKRILDELLSIINRYPLDGVNIHRLNGIHHILKHLNDDDNQSRIWMDYHTAINAAVEILIEIEEMLNPAEQTQFDYISEFLSENG